MLLFIGSPISFIEVTQSAERKGARFYLANQLTNISHEVIKPTDNITITLRKNVTSPNGTTAAALSVFTDKDLEKIVLDAMTAAKKRAQELA